MTETNQSTEFRSAIEECFAVANHILETQDEIETKTKLWKSTGWNYFMKPVPGTTEEEAAEENANFMQMLKMWFGIPVGCFVLGVLLMMVDLDFTRGLGGLLLTIGIVGLFVSIVILPMKLSNKGSLKQLNEQMSMLYKGSWLSAKKNVDDLIQKSYNDAKEYLTEYNAIGVMDKQLKALTPVTGIAQMFANNQANLPQGAKDGIVQNLRIIMTQNSFDNVQKINCPKCNSDKLEFDEQTEVSGGFNKKFACLGFICFGPLGLLCGNHNAQPKQVHKTHWKCSNCKTKI